jgi:hypothetical protein
VRFEVDHFEDEWDTVRHRFIGQKEGGRAALQFGSPCVEEGTAHGAAMLTGRVAAARASEGRRRCQRWAKLGPKQKRAGRLDGPSWWGGPRWATAMAGRKNEKKNWKEPMGFNGAQAELRWAEKEEKNNRFRNFLIQGNGIEIKSFEYFQTKFELDSK